MEKELKLIPKQEISQEELLRVLVTEGYTIEDTINKIEQEDMYYDTPDKAFYNSERSFRIRKKEGKVYVTYKVSTGKENGYTEREEFEAEIPFSNVEQDGNVTITDAIHFLKQRYPEVELPENLALAVTINNTRSKVNIKSKDGSIMELAFDDAHAQTSNGETFKMNNEIECEAMSGNSEELNNVFRIIDTNYDVQRNTVSKYVRAINEIKEQKQNMTLEEITICAILSDIISTNEFEQLKHKGQIIHDYRIQMPDNLDLSNFKDSKYLIDKISSVKRIKNYRPRKIRNLEDMFLCFFSDMDYQDIEYKLVNFLNENYYREDQAITNRMTHSQQAMLIAGLISRSKEIAEKDKNTLLCMASALAHDIGHVPGAHPTEFILGSLDGFFSHEINGRDVIERTISTDEDKIKGAIKKYAEEIGKEYPEERIEKTIQMIKTMMKRSIEEHSRTNSESRGDGTVVQLPREADKICYGVSDIVDVIKNTTRTGIHLPEGFFSKEWKEKTIKKLGKGYEREEIIRKRLEEFDKLIRTENFGELITNIANTVRENQNDGRIYYDVEQDTWDILNEMIAYVKTLREKGIIDVRKKEMQSAATIFIVSKFNEAMAKHPDNLEEAWEETLRNVTASNDLDMLNTVNEIYNRFKQNPEELSEVFEKGGLLDLTQILNLDNANRQIKLKPNGLFDMSEMLPFFGGTYSLTLPDRFRDTYFNSENGVSICLREYLNRRKQELIVKRKRDKRSNTSRKRKICYRRL